MPSKNPCPYRPDTPIIASDGAQKSLLRFRTLQQVEDALDWSTNCDADTRLSSRRDESGDRNPWTGTETIQQYAEMLRDGWPEGMKGMEGLEGLSSDAHERLQFVRNVGGVFPIVPAALAGAPDSMLDCRPMPTDSVRGLTLVIDSSFSAGVKPQTALTYAHSVMRLIAWLQSERVDTSVYIVCPIVFSSTRYVYVTPIRETGQILQPERIAAMVHPSWLRRAWFALVEREYYDYDLPGTSTCRGGFGHVQHVTADEMRQCLPEAYSVIMLPKVGSGDPDKAVRDAISLKLRQE